MQNADLKLIMKPQTALGPALYPSPVTYVSTPIDVESFEVVYMHFYCALNSGATGTLRLQTADTSGGTYTNVSGVALALSDAYNGLPNVWYKARTGELKQFVRVQLTVSTGTPSCGVFLHRYDPLNGADQTTAYPN